MKFDEWFLLQFGKRPSNKSILDLKDEAESLSIQLKWAKDLYHNVEKWERTRTETRYAWNIEDKDKE